MKLKNNPEDVRYVRRWRGERDRKVVEIPLPTDVNTMISILRDSDIEDRRKVVALWASDSSNDKFDGVSRLYYGIEDAVASLYEEGCTFYLCSSSLRMRYPSGNKIEFHRMEYVNEDNIDEIYLSTYLRVVKQSRKVLRRTKIYISWEDKNGEHNY